MDDSTDDENDKTTSENTERNKNIPTFGLPSDDEDDVPDNSCHGNHLEPPVIAVKGTHV